MYGRLKDLRDDNELTQTELAALLHCSQRIYSNYERGDVDIPTAVLIQLACLYHTSTDYILGLTNTPTPYPPPNSTVK